MNTLPDFARSEAASAAGSTGPRPRVLIADDNAELREYARGLLAERYEVQAVEDGEAALAAARAHVPDLIVTDVRIPKLDGFGLIQALRADAAMSEVPVIALSARAGEEARLEGLQRGADDYLAKPFSARELLVRVETLLRSQEIRRQAREALRSSEARYRALLGLMPAAVYTCEAPSGVISFFNDHAAALWGRKPALGSTDQRFCGSFRLWLPDGALLPHAETPMAIAMREGRSFRNQVVVMERTDGSRITVLVNIDPLRDAAGRVTGAINVFHDVSERRAAEERLRRSEQELSDFFETAAIGLHWVGPDGVIQRVNRAELELLGYSREEYVGHHIAEFHVDRRVIDDILDRLTRGEWLHEYPAQMRCKDGSIRDVLINSSVLFENGRFVHTRCFTQDVTESKRLEALLQCQKEALELVTRRAPLLEVLAHLARAIERESPGLMTAIHLLNGNGTCFEEAVAPSLPAAYLQATRGLQIAPGVGPCCDVVLRGETVSAADVATDARWAPFAELAAACGIRAGWSTPIFSSQGRIIGTFANYYGEPCEPRPLDQRLPEMVTRTVTLAVEHRQAEDALRESDRRKDEFIAMLSHELRNPLAPLRSALDLLRQSADTAQAQLIAMMERQVNQLVRLVDDLLETSRISQGLLELRRERLQVADLVRGAVEACEPLLRERGHHLAIDLPAETLWLDADPVRLGQALTNLLNNAARYTGPGGRIWLSARREPDARIRVSVRDTGIGFSPEMKAMLFEMFTRGDASRGLGIGLALVRRLVEMHGGGVEARSEGVGRGAEFIVTLPLAENTLAAPSPTRTVPVDGRNCRVLVADDNRDAAESLAMLLRTLGNEVAIAYDGVEAVEAARSFRPHVVLLDIGMPRLDGYGAARQIRGDLASQPARIVALTGWGQDEDRRRARDAGFDAHLVKPAELDALCRILDDIPRQELPD